MKCLFVSDKVCWRDSTSPDSFSTVGGFPFQIKAISQLFDQMRIIIFERNQPAPPNLLPIGGHNLDIHPLPEPPGVNWQRKITILLWLVKYGGTLWYEIKQSDVLHVNVPGDLGGIAILLGLMQQKRMFIRHCGTWNQPVTLANKALLWLLERIANGETTIVFATGYDDKSPSARNRNISWIFSTTLDDQELKNLITASPWKQGGTLLLVTVGRLVLLKNIQAILDAIPNIMEVYPNVQLSIVGDGPYESALKQLVHDKHLESVVKFTGNLDHANVLNTLSESNLFIFPTRVKEGFPKAVLEALACGLPVVATRISVIPHLLNNGCGVLLDETDGSAVAGAILDLISDPERLAKMGKLAHQAARGYTLEAWRETIGQCLRSAWGPLKNLDEVNR